MTPEGLRVINTGCGGWEATPSLSKSHYSHPYIENVPVANAMHLITPHVDAVCPSSHRLYVTPLLKIVVSHSVVLPMVIIISLDVNNLSAHKRKHKLSSLFLNTQTFIPRYQVSQVFHLMKPIQQPSKWYPCELQLLYSVESTQRSFLKFKCKPVFKRTHLF